MLNQSVDHTAANIHAIYLLFIKLYLYRVKYTENHRFTTLPCNYSIKKKFAIKNKKYKSRPIHQ